MGVEGKEVRRLARGEEGGGAYDGYGSSSRGRSERENKERVILTEEIIIGLVRNLAIGKFPGTHKDDPS